LEAGTYQSRRGGPLLNINERPAHAAVRAVQGTLGINQPTGFLDALGQFGSSLGKAAKSSYQNWQQGLERESGGAAPGFITAPLAAAMTPIDLAARGIEGMATGLESAGKDVYQGMKRNDPRAMAYGTGELGGNLAQAEIGKEAPGAAEDIATTARRSKPAVGLALRTEKGALKPIVRQTGGLAGAAIGHASGIPVLGPLIGYGIGENVANALIPKRPWDVPVRTNPGGSLPLASDFYAQKAADLAKRGTQQAALDRVAARTAPNRPKIAAPGTPEARFSGSEGRAATWTNEDVMRLAAKGNREAISQAIRRGMQLPIGARYVMGDPDMARAVYNPRETTKFTPEGQPIRNMQNLNIPQSSRARIQLPWEQGSMATPQLRPAVQEMAQPSGAAKVPEWNAGQADFEITRLKNILRNPQATAEEKAIAQSQLQNYGKVF
jgi:hypothetical protein